TAPAPAAAVPRAAARRRLRRICRRRSAPRRPCALHATCFRRMRTIGVIGGSGLYEIEGLTDQRWVKLDTPFGAPSDEYLTGRLGDAKLVFLPRHGRGHRVLPHEINFRANVHGMKQLGVEWILSVSAVGSMKEEIHPGDIVIVDQFIDRTKARESSF